jgi:hypothetical protein
LSVTCLSFHPSVNLTQIFLGDGIQVCSNEGQHPSLRGDNRKRVKMFKKYFRIFFFRTTGPISTRLSTHHPLKEGIQISSNEGWHPSLRGDNSKRVKINTIF